ncbi:MAG: asparagine synthase (glutamine-hydrolyzing) [Pseudomonadales bacterium]|nr:asparagine synthase (glutamine-hydrolyzing) [Pseudomonadales bacterium]MCP5185805.1 asparagine synthase (glutamine-hydrolyzing) [Pseudomonadales bacterium]
MCGIAGIVGTTDTGTVHRMCDVMQYRGPDNTSVRAFDGATLGMVRLSIIDLTGGTQPIPNETGDIWVVFNGEIYNYEDLRADLQARGHRFRTSSDTETIVHAYEEYGEDFPNHLRGMFAIALWDERQRKMILVRDRLGEKPLYYHLANRKLYFASEIKCLLAAGVQAECNRDAAATFLALGYVPAPETAYLNIFKLCPGEMAIYQDDTLRLQRYWSLLPRQIQNIGYQDAVDQLDDGLRTAIRYCLKSDVEVAAFLSGGLDSSLISALMCDAGASVRTYSIGFDDAARGFSELPFAQRVAEHLGTRHSTFVVSEREAQSLVPTVLDHYDEPNGEPTSVLVNLLCERVARDVKVAMGGTGGDELFHGYPRHGKIGALTWASRVPDNIATLTRSLLDRLPDSTSGNRLIRRAKRFGRALGLSPEAGYRQWLLLLDASLGAGMVLGAQDTNADAFVSRRLSEGTSFMQRILDVDVGGYLPEFQLTYMDRMSMANSLEVRSPLCDYTIAELAASLPAEYRLRGNQTKRILKDVARRYLPSEIVDRPKVGFDAPVGLWFKSALRPQLETTLSRDAVARTGLLNPDRVNAMVQLHLAGKHDYSMQLWSILSLEHWYRRHIEEGGRLPDTKKVEVTTWSRTA